MTGFKRWQKISGTMQSHMTKRKLFDELMEGVAAMIAHREGKITLPTRLSGSQPRPIVGELPQSNGENKIAKECMPDAGKK